MPPSDSEDVERREARGRPASLHIELRSDAPDEFRFMAFGGEHHAEKKEFAGLDGFHVGSEGLRRGWKSDAEFFQFLFGASSTGDIARYPSLPGFRFHISFSA